MLQWRPRVLQIILTVFMFTITVAELQVQPTIAASQQSAIKPRISYFSPQLVPLKVSWSLVLFVFSAFSLPGFANPTAPNDLHARQDVQNIVYVTDANKFCMIMPRDPHTNIGDSEHPGGMITYCSPNGRYSPEQGELPADFWRSVEFSTGNGLNGGRYAQLTGCIRPEGVDRLNPADAGGQYDSSGGVGGLGNPQGSICLGYNHYVELVEPAGPRACIKCCDDPADCPTDKDQSGCPGVISGNYFDCD